MMKLKHLFNNEDLAVMAVKYWDYDEASLELFKYYRISANALYPFKKDGALQYLRLAPVDEKPHGVDGEVEYLEYLKANGYPVVDLIPSKGNHLLEEIETPWGPYYALVFQGIQGGTLEDAILTSEMIFDYGALLGQLHKLSQNHQPTGNKRPTIFHQLEWSKEVLRAFGNEEEMLSKIDCLEKYLKAIPQSNDSFGLIHFDYELDNVLVDKDSKELYVIDFDDSMYSWYAMDIMNALTNLEEEISPENYPIYKEEFLKGYGSILTVNSLDDQALEALSTFNHIYKYTRVRRSIDDTWINEPDWMIQLRKKLEEHLNRLNTAITY